MGFAGLLRYDELGNIIPRHLQLRPSYELGCSSAGFGVHSLRAGSLTAVAGSGMPERLFKIPPHIWTYLLSSGIIRATMLSKRIQSIDTSL